MSSNVLLEYKQVVSFYLMQTKFSGVYWNQPVLKYVRLSICKHTNALIVGSILVKLNTATHST